MIRTNELKAGQSPFSGSQAGVASSPPGSSFVLAGPPRLKFYVEDGASGAAVVSNESQLAKLAPNATHPVLVFWKHLGNIDGSSGIWTHKTTIVEANPSFQDYWTVPGYTKPSTAYYLANHGSGANFNQTDANDLIDCSDANLQAKIDAHAASDAQHIADCLHKQGLLRGKGPLGGGNYGGSFNHHEWGSHGSFATAAANYRFTAFLGHPSDAALINRTQTLKTGPSTTRVVTLPKVNALGSFVYDIQTAAGRAANEAATDGMRPSTYLSLVATNGIAAARRYMVALAAAVKAKCDSYDPPGGGAAVQLCYPAWIHHSWEYEVFYNRFNSQSYINAGDPPAEGAGYYHIGPLWHIRGNYDSPSALWTTPIFYEKDGDGNYTIARSYKTALEADADLAIYSTSYTPGLNQSLNPNTTQRAKMFAIEFATAAHILHKACAEPWRDYMPETKTSNYDFVTVADTSNAYKRAGQEVGAISSIQTVNQLDAHAPSFYGRYGSSQPSVVAIKNAAPGAATDAAVQAWNDENFADVVAIIDQLDPTIPVDAYVYGVYSPAQLQAGQTQLNQWGGDARFFKNLLKALYVRGIYKYVVFSGDPELTFTAWKEFESDVAAGNLSIVW